MATWAPRELRIYFDTRQVKTTSSSVSAGMTVVGRQTGNCYESTLRDFRTEAHPSSLMPNSVAGGDTVGKLFDRPSLVWIGQDA